MISYPVSPYGVCGLESLVDPGIRQISAYKAPSPNSLVQQELVAAEDWKALALMM